MSRSKKHVFSKPKLIFFGNERLATGVSTDAPALRALVTAGYQVKAVIASHSEGTSRKKRVLEIVDVAHAYHIPVHLPKKVAEIRADLKRLEAAAGVLVAFGQLLPTEIIDIFPKGIINIHPSLLPKLRGTTPVETAILNGMEETGVSLMHLTSEMDAGPVYAQKAVRLNGSETKPQLAKLLLDAGSQLLIEHLEAIVAGSLKPKPQDETEATFTRLLTKKDGEIDFNQPADLIEREVRAFLDFPKSRAKVFGREIVITKARVADSATDGNLVIKCQPGYLEIVELTAPSGRTMSGAEFIRGYKK